MGINTNEGVWTYAVDENNFKGIANNIFVDGENVFSDYTPEDAVKDGYKILTEDEFHNLVKEYEKSLCGKWVEIDEETYNDALNVLPPVKWYDGGFYMGEMFTGTISGFYQEIDGRFFTSFQDLFTPREEVIADLRNFMEA